MIIYDFRYSPFGMGYHQDSQSQWANGMVFVASPNCHHNLINSHGYSHETMENQRILTINHDSFHQIDECINMKLVVSHQGLIN